MLLTDFARIATSLPAYRDVRRAITLSAVLATLACTPGTAAAQATPADTPVFDTGINASAPRATDTEWLRKIKVEFELKLDKITAPAMQFFAGCTVTPGKFVQRTLPNGKVGVARIRPVVSGRCLGHQFAVDALPSAQVPVENQRCDIELHEIPPPTARSYWSIGYCSFDGEPVISVALYGPGDLQGRLLTIQRWLTAEQTAEAALTPKQRNDGPTLSRLHEAAGIAGEASGKDALRIGWAIFHEHWQNCGDTELSSRYEAYLDPPNASSMSGRPDNYKNEANVIVELKGIEAVVRADELTTADRLNGIGWRGTVMIAADVYRSYSSVKEWGERATPGWGSWHDGTTPLLLTLSNQSGRWRIIGTADFGEYGIVYWGSTLYGGSRRSQLPKPLACNRRP